MEALLSKKQLENSNENFKDFKYTIDTKGIIIFHLKSGGTIRDTGKEIYFSTHDINAKDIALEYAKNKWGKNFSINENNKISFLAKEKG